MRKNLQKGGRRDGGSEFFLSPLFSRSMQWSALAVNIPTKKAICFCPKVICLFICSPKEKPVKHIPQKKKKKTQGTLLHLSFIVPLSFLFFQFPFSHLTSPEQKNES